MMDSKKLRVAMPAWEIGRPASGLGTKIGGLGVIIEELPTELVKAGSRQGIELEVETLSPCFAHYDRSRFTKLDMHIPVTLGGHTFGFEVYEHTFPDGQKVVYFWDDWQLNWTNSNAIYPNDLQMALPLYAAVSQAMAGYIKQRRFDTVHLHDYHVGLIPFYLGDDELRNVPVHFTVHNASYQGITPLVGGGYSTLDRINLPGWRVFHHYFEYYDNLNLMKATMLKVYESGGKITTVSGDIEGTWGYAAELKQSQAEVWMQAYAQKGSPPREVFLPNRHLDLFEKLPIAGITNGLSEHHRPEQMPQLSAEFLNRVQDQRGSNAPLFRHPITQAEMLSRDHHFDADHLSIKAELKRMLHLEAFGCEPDWDPILFTAVGRLVEQKNLGLVAAVMERVLATDGGAKFIILASAAEGDPGGKALEASFLHLAHLYPNRVFFDNTFNPFLAKLIFAGGDFCLIPSRFEPCGLVDYEASLVGNVVIGRATGGLTKVRHCAFLYEWLDIGDWWGEAGALFRQIIAAVDTYRHNPTRHADMIRTAMAVNAGWEASAGLYVGMYRYGLLAKKWYGGRRDLVDDFITSLGDDRELFAQFFIPAKAEFSDALDWQLKQRLHAAHS